MDKIVTLMQEVSATLQLEIKDYQIKYEALHSKILSLESKPGDATGCREELDGNRPTFKSCLSVGIQAGDTVNGLSLGRFI